MVFFAVSIKYIAYTEQGEDNETIILDGALLLYIYTPVGSNYTYGEAHQ